MEGIAPHVAERAQRSPAELATDRALDLELDAVLTGEPHAPDGTVFVPADLPFLGPVLDRHLRAGQTVVLVFADGHRRVLEAGRVFRFRVRLADRLRSAADRLDRIATRHAE